MKTPLASFSTEDIQSLKPALKIGLLATVNPQGQPHITLLSSLMATSPRQMAFGQFTEGLSKGHLLENPQAGFMIMSLDKHLWRGKARFTHRATGGADYDYYNNVPMFRYNAYFGVHTVHYLDLMGHTGKDTLPMNRIIAAAVLTMLARSLGRKQTREAVLNTWTLAFLNKLDNLKFLAYIGSDGYPVVIPTIQAQGLDAGHIVFSNTVYRDELEAIPPGASLALFGMSLSMEDVLVRGTYQGMHRVGGIRVGILQAEWVYNPMPPVSGQIYPPVKIKAVTEF
jgi:hypothetical protein